MPTHFALRRGISPKELREWRERQKWSQADAALWYGVAARSWRRYEAGERKIPKPLERLLLGRGRRGETGKGRSHRNRRPRDSK